MLGALCAIGKIVHMDSYLFRDSGLHYPKSVARTVAGNSNCLGMSFPQTPSSIDEKSKGEAFSNGRPRCQNVGQLFDARAPR